MNSVTNKLQVTTAHAKFAQVLTGSVGQGFNAWGQLCFKESPRLDDFLTFECILEEDSIENVHASLSCTLGLLSAGYPDDWVNLPELRDQVLQSTAAVAGNGQIAVYDGDETITQYRSTSEFAAKTTSRTYSGLRGIIQIVAYETGFAALSSGGQVWSWGDERYGACLGRDVTTLRPANKPGLVEELEDLPTGPTRKLAAAGYLITALTEGHDMYAWGGHPGRRAPIEDMSVNPTPIAVDEKDIADCAVGESHAVILTTDGEIFVTGGNTNGQLGLAGHKIASWTRVSLKLADGSLASAVCCGPRNSFIIVSSNNTRVA